MIMPCMICHSLLIFQYFHPSLHDNHMHIHMDLKSHECEDLKDKNMEICTRGDCGSGGRAGRLLIR